MNVDDLGAGAHTPRDGWCDPNGLLWGFRRKAVELGAVYVKDRVVAAEISRALATQRTQAVSHVPGS
jgi:glycine/D-amino acid oxidase-like deaminating enzyme